MRKRVSSYLSVAVAISMFASALSGAAVARNAATNLVVSADGSDTSSCSRSAPCASFNRAYQLARPGQIVDVLAGDYREQTMRGTKAGKVTFRLARGTTVGHLAVHADNLEVAGGRIEGIDVYQNSSRFTSRGTDRGIFSVWGADYASFIGGDVGPEDEPNGDTPHPWISFGEGKENKEPTHVLIDGVYFHDIRAGKAGDHNECIFVVGGNGLTIRNSRFVRCDIFAIYGGTPWFGENLPPVRNVTIENNVFDASTSEGKYDCCSYSVHFANDWTRLDNFRIAYNSAKMPMSFGDDATPKLGFTFVGNVMPNDACDPRGTYSHNVFIGGPRCSPTDRSVANLAAAGFVAPFAREPNLHLRATSRAIDAGDPSDFPRRDIFGRHRPQGRAPDAGAVESR
jgi:hypothetical protein